MSKIWQMTIPSMDEQVSSVHVIHELRNLIHGWKCHPWMSTMDGKTSFMDNIHRWRWKMKDMDKANVMIGQNYHFLIFIGQSLGYFKRPLPFLQYLTRNKIFLIKAKHKHWNKCFNNSIFFSDRYIFISSVCIPVLSRSQTLLYNTKMYCKVIDRLWGRWAKV